RGGDVDVGGRAPQPGVVERRAGRGQHRVVGAARAAGAARADDDQVGARVVGRVRAEEARGGDVDVLGEAPLTRGVELRPGGGQDAVGRAAGVPVVARRDGQDVLLAVVVEVAADKARAGDVDVVGRAPHAGGRQPRARRGQDVVVDAARVPVVLGRDDRHVVAAVGVEVAEQEARAGGTAGVGGRAGLQRAGVGDVRDAVAVRVGGRKGGRRAGGAAGAGRAGVGAGPVD